MEESLDVKARERETGVRGVIIYQPNHKRDVPMKTSGMECASF